MNIKTTFFSLSLLGAILAGCSSPETGSRITNQDQPGPQVGHAVGTAVGTVAGNVTGGVAAVGEGVVSGVSESFTPQDATIIRRWEKVTTPDGRVIDVEKQYLVDKKGNIIREIKK